MLSFRSNCSRKIMKRDLDLIRTILLRLESMEVAAGHYVPVGPNELKTAGYCGEQVAYHIQLLKSGGFIRELGSKRALDPVGERPLPSRRTARTDRGVIAAQPSIRGVIP
jgi:hypothetical protein